MPYLPDWDKCLIEQRDLERGCIPTGYEWMTRVAGIEDVNLETFQEDFNLEARGEGENNFDSIAEAVERRYPGVRIQRKSFETGEEKAEFIQELMEKGIPCLMSLALDPGGKCHIAPVIYVDDQRMELAWMVDKEGMARICEISLDEVKKVHDDWPGGKDIAWLDQEQ
jgi:hypothetical protein